MSDAEGNFNLTDLVPGTYEIKVFARGFRVAILSNLQVAVGQTQGIEVKVRVPATTMAGGVHTHGGAAGGGAAGSGGEGQPKDGAPTPMPQLTPPPLELQKFHEPVWNVWTENTKVDSPTFKPVDMLPGHSYLLVVDLAALQYAKYASQAYSHEASPAFDNWLARNPDDETTVKVLAIPDDRFFQNMVGKRSQKLLINLKKLRATQQQGFQLTGSPFEYLATHNGDAPFTFGKAIFRVKTKDNAVGTAAITFSIWADHRPVDELSFSVCIVAKLGDPCARAPATGSLRGVDATNRDSFPDAALHLIEPASQNGLIGVFRCNTCNWGADDFKVWKVDHSAAWLRDQFARTVLRGIQLGANGVDPENDPSFNEATFNNAGNALYSLIFPTQDEEAEAAFRRFVAEKVAHEKPGGIAPSLFVRLLPQQKDNGFFIPMGLARVKVSTEREDFLGFHFRIESPLELQDYSSPATCINKWTLLVPPESLSLNPLMEARAPFNDWIAKFGNANATAKVYDDLGEFYAWLNPKPGETETSRVILILSHHESNSLYFKDQSDSAIFPKNVSRRFAMGSVAIMDACATANPGAFEFVREFNSHGVNAVVASSVEINGKMGGLFLSDLVNMFDKNNADQSYTLDRAVFDAINKLQAEPESDDDPRAKPYGPRALLFGLLGNGKLKVCTAPAP